MSVRAIAIRNGPRTMSPPAARSPAARLQISPTRTRRRVGSLRRGIWGALADDRRLIGVKMVVLGLVALAAMALEVLP